MRIRDAGRRWSDRQVEQFVGRLLQGGVLLAATVVLAGAVLLLARRGGEVADFRSFEGPPLRLRTPGGILSAALALEPAAIIQLGLVLLVATPVARVALTLVAFVIQKDRLYAVMTAIVLALLLAGLGFGMGA